MIWKDKRKDELKEGWIKAWKDKRKDERMNVVGWKEGWKEGWKDECSRMKGWMKWDEWKEARMNEWMNEWNYLVGMNYTTC